PAVDGKHCGSAQSGRRRAGTEGLGFGSIAASNRIGLRDSSAPADEFWQKSRMTVPAPQPLRTMKTLPSLPLVCTLACSTCLFLPAQQTPPAPASPAPNTVTPPVAPPPPAAEDPTAAVTSEKIVRLEALEVVTEADQGYIAVNALAGGRAMTPIRL